MTLYDLLTEGSAALLQAGDTDGENDAKLLLFEVFPDGPPASPFRK